MAPTPATLKPWRVAIRPRCVKPPGAAARNRERRGSVCRNQQGTATVGRDAWLKGQVHHEIPGQEAAGLSRHPNVVGLEGRSVERHSGSVRVERAGGAHVLLIQHQGGGSKKHTDLRRIPWITRVPPNCLSLGGQPLVGSQVVIVAKPDSSGV